MASGSDGSQPTKDEQDGGGSDGGESVFSPAEHSIRIHRWKVREGFQVTRNQIILLYTVPVDADADGAAAGAPAGTDLKRLKAAQTGVVRKRLFKDGDTVAKGTALLELGPCIHTTVIKDMCADCGADLRHDEPTSGAGSGGGGSAGGGGGGAAVTEMASVPMIHSVPELKVTQQLAQKLGKADTRRLLEDRKLVLLVDLDQTIIHTTNDNVPNNVRDVYHFQLYGAHSPWYHTRLRPGTFRFLSRMTALFELHICTFGARNYAHRIAQFLDADGKYFSHRILSRDECFNLASKTDNLKALFPCGDSMVCIIDDREDVWNMASNLIQVKPYHFFQHTGDINAPPGMAKHELDGKGVDFKDMLKSDAKDKPKSATDADADNAKETTTPAAEAASPTDVASSTAAATEVKSSASIPADENKPLAPTASSQPEPTAKVADATKKSAADDNLIDVEDPDDYLLYLETILKQIHTRFYQHYDGNGTLPDLKQLVPKIRGEILRGRTLVFSGLVPNQQRLEVSKAYVIARSLGATVKQQLTDETTHLVAATAGTFKVNAARKRPEINVVTPEWLWSCAERWECVEERLFPLDPLRPSKMRQPPPHCHSPEHATNYGEQAGGSGSSDGGGGGNGDQVPGNTKRLKGGSAKNATARPGSSRSADGAPKRVAGAGSDDSNDVDDDDSNSGSGQKFMDTINPLLSFTTDDLDDMNQEFDQFFDSDGDSSSSADDEPNDMENPPSDKMLKKRRRREEEKEQRTKPPTIFRPESEELVKLPSCPSPRKKQRIRGVDERPRAPEEDASNDAIAGGDDDDDDAVGGGAGSSGSEREGIDYNDDDDIDIDGNGGDDDEMPSSRFRRGADLPSEPDMGSDCGSAGSAEPADDDDEGDWNQMGAALEREFLGMD